MRRRGATWRASACRPSESRVRAAEQTVARLRPARGREEIEAARARVAAAAAQVATVEEAVNDTSLASPIAGIVTEKLVEVGEVIAPRTPVVVISDLVNVWADVFVPEPSCRASLGQPATVFTDAGGSGLAGHRQLHLAEGGVHSAQRADGRGAIEARVSRARFGGQQGRRAQARHAGRSGHAAAGTAMTAHGPRPPVHGPRSTVHDPP